LFFRLNPECFFIRGVRFGAIYDLIEGDIYSLDSHESDLVQQCENNEIISSSNDFLIKLKQQCLGNFYEKPVYIEKVRVGSPIISYQPGSPPVINRAFLEINNSCDQSCWYCGYYGIHRSNGCYGCNKWNESGEDVSIERWKELIDELSDLECQSLFFTGGDLTCVWDKTLELVNHASNSFQKIFICLNNNKINDNILGDIRSKAVPIIQTDSVFDENSENVYLSIVDVDRKQEPPKNSKNIIIDYISKNFNSPQTRNVLHPAKKILKTDIFRFSHNKKVHPCIGNNIVVTWNGEILPCPMLRSFSVGNIKNSPLYSVFAKKDTLLEKYWSLRLDSLSNCGKCEFRFACTECRAVEYSITGDITKNELCSYDPTEGTWI